MSLVIVTATIVSVAVVGFALHRLVNPKVKPAEPVKGKRSFVSSDRLRYTKKRNRYGRREVYDSHTNEWLLWYTVFSEPSYHSCGLPTERQDTRPSEDDRSVTSNHSIPAVSSGWGGVDSSPTTSFGSTSSGFSSSSYGGSSGYDGGSSSSFSSSSSSFD